MIDKVNIAPIVAAHFRTFRSFESRRLAPGDFILFLILPLLLSVGLVISDVTLPSMAIGTLVTALSVFVGLFFNVLILVADLALRSDEQASRNRQLKIKTRVAREVHANVSFAILISVFALLALVTLSFSGPFPDGRLRRSRFF